MYNLQIYEIFDKNKCFLFNIYLLKNGLNLEKNV